MGACASEDHCGVDVHRDADADVEETSLQSTVGISLELDAPSIASTHLLEAAAQGDVILATVALQDGARLSHANALGRTPLHLAAEHGHKDMVQLLLEAGASRETQDDKGRTPLALAATKSQYGAVSSFLLLDKLCLQRELLDAARRRDVEVARAMLLCSANVSSKNHEGFTSLHLAASNGHYEMSRLLLKEKAKIDEQNEVGCSALRLAAKKGHIEVVQFLIDKGAKSGPGDKKILGRTLLHAAEKGDVAKVKMLLMCQASIDETRDGNTPLLLAAEKGHHEVAKLLMDKGASMADMGVLGKRLRDACETGRLKEAADLLDLGVKVDLEDVFCETSLWKAASEGYIEVVELLVGKTANLEARSRNCNRTPLVIAIDRGKLDVAKFLARSGARLPDAARLNCKLVDAVEEDDLERARTLIHFKATPCAPTQDGKAPLQQATGVSAQMLQLLHT